MHALKQSDTSKVILLFMADSANPLAGKTGLTPTVTLSKNGAAFAAGAGSVAELAGGFYAYTPAVADLATLGPLAVRATGTAAVDFQDVYQVVAFDPYDAADLGLTNLDATITSRHASGAAVASVTGNVGGSVASVTALAAGERNAIADALLTRDWTAVTGEAARSVLNALRRLRNKVTRSGSTGTVMEEDDSTSAWTMTLTTDASAPNVVEVDPS